MRTRLRQLEAFRWKDSPSCAHMPSIAHDITHDVRVKWYLQLPRRLGYDRVCHLIWTGKREASSQGRLCIDVCPLEEEYVSFTFILSLTYSKRDGLGFEFTCNKDYKLTHFSSEKLHILFKSVFGTASACDLQGQALLMALTSRSDLWKEAVLKCEPNAPWQEEGSAK